MTIREVASLVFVLLGGIAVTVAAGLIGGPRWALAVGGVLLLLVGVLLGLGGPEDAYTPPTREARPAAVEAPPVELVERVDPAELPVNAAGLPAWRG